MNKKNSIKRHYCKNDSIRLKHKYENTMNSEVKQYKLSKEEIEIYLKTGKMPNEKCL